MQGNETTRVKKFKDFFGVQGKTQKICGISPRERKLQSQMYLKWVMQGSNPGLKTTATQSESFTQYATEDKPPVKSFFIAENPEKIIKFDVDSKFALHCQDLSRKHLKSLTKQLFPNELNEEIHYLPDFSQSKIRDFLPLPQKTRINISEEIKYKTVQNMVKTRQKPASINLSLIMKHKFSTYTTGWKTEYNAKNQQKVLKNIT